MLTECPSCLTVFRVTGAILKMGHGQVRCGKCRTQFDALDSLLDDESANETIKATLTANSSSPSNADVVQEEPAIEARAPDIAEEITLEGSRIEISGTYRVAADESHDESALAPDQFVHEHVVIDRDETAATESNHDADLSHLSDEHGEESIAEPIEEQYVELNADDDEPVAEAASHLLADTGAFENDAEPVPLSHRVWKRARLKREQQQTEQLAEQNNKQQSDVTEQIDAELSALTQTKRPAEPRAGMWTALTIVLVVAFIAQLVHHNRDAFIRSPKWGGAITGVYRTLGLSLTPHWDLGAYEVQQWGVISDASAHDALRVRASVTNTAAFSQPYPHIKLALEDRWGSPVAMREFTPEEYLQSSASANRMMAPRQRANAEIVIIDPGADAVGFQIHACLLQGKATVCSDDLPAVHP